MSWLDTITPVLDACGAALILIDCEQRVSYLNTAAQPLSHAGLAVGVPVARALGDNLPALSNDARFTAQLPEDRYGITVREIDADHGTWHLLTLTRIGPQQRLKQELKRIESSCAQGDLSSRIDTNVQSGMAAQVTQRVNAMLDHIRTDISTLSEAISKMADCDLQTELSTGKPGELGALQTRLSVTVSNLSESIRQTINSSQAIATTATQIASQNKQLETRTRAQTDAILHTTSNMTELSAAVANAAENAVNANQQGQETMQLAESGRNAVIKVVTAMDSIDQSATEVNNIIGIINDIAFQTNILALNAAVEAARAGEHGRGFSIVATEVRSLASRSADAANQIKELIQRSAEIASDGKKLAVEADQRMGDIVSGVKHTSEQINAISAAAQEQTTGIQDARQALDEIEDITRKNHELVAELAHNTDSLDRQAKYLNEAAQVFRLSDQELTHPLHQRAREACISTAAAVGRAFEKAIEQRQISAEALFNNSYTPIANTDPPKHSTPFDALGDEVLPAIQEHQLQAEPEFVYAISADINGYVPTHNDKFCKPLTGDYQTDLAGNRTKRVFSDRVGEQVGRHTEEWKLQTYRRDTGELMFDMSAPIYVKGKHWGGFRIGYRIT